jgi:hypothetical protein
MDDITVTRHAMDRYRERVADLPDREIFARLSGPAFTLAVELAAPMVKLPGGQHAVLRGGAVVTVLPTEASVHTLDRFSARRTCRSRPL